jgi:integrase
MDERERKIEALQHGHDGAAACNDKSYLRRLMVEQKLGPQAQGPKPAPQPPRFYGTPLPEMAQPLRKQVEELLRDAVARPGYPKLRGETRPVTKEAIRDFLCRFVGYVTRVRGSQISSLDQLLTRDLLQEFLGWCQDSRHIKASGLRPHLARLHGAVKQYRHPPLAGKDFHWIQELMKELRRESPAQIRQRKAAKWVDYELLEQIPARIRARAEALGPYYQGRQLATLRRDELIFTWLLILPWRSRNLRECRVGDEAQGANLFKCELTPFATVAKPDWVKQALRVNPHEKFWMFYFRGHETKSGREVRSLLPEQLIAPLEEYLRDYRPTLLGDNHEACSPLFPNSRGKPIATPALGKIVAGHTLRYTGRRLHPHLVRDIVAVTWLDHHPDDHLTVSKLLWHRDALTTLLVYAQNFNESHAVCRMEAWLRSRRQSKDDASAGRFQAPDQESESRSQGVSSLLSRRSRWFGRRGRGTT